MKIHHDFNFVSIKRPVITSGVFDGVHIGHQKILSTLKSIALDADGESMVVTFWPHPKEVLKKDSDLKLINTLEEKIKLLEEVGLDHLVIIPFSQEFSKFSSEAYIHEFLVKRLNIQHLVVGFNHHFGHDRLGDFSRISQLANEYKFKATLVEAAFLNGTQISSTLIRTFLANGEMDKVNQTLGYPYQFSGDVVYGKQIGRTIGFPTANLSINSPLKIIPKIGVYAVWALVNGKKTPGMMNIGIRPTLEEEKPKISIEVHLINFNENIYNQTITIIFEKKIRDEIKFSGLDQLKNQLFSDKKEVMNLLGVNE